MLTLPGDGVTPVSFEIAPFGPGSVNNYSVHPKGAFAMPPYRPLEERFWAKVVDTGTPPTYRPDLGSCWIWMGATNKGYGHIRNGNKTLAAHRVGYELEYGPVPSGLELDHLCRVHGCVRPSHLEPVTRRENVLRGVSWFAIQARKTECKHGHPFTPENTRTHGSNGRKCRTCSKVIALAARKTPQRRAAINARCKERRQNDPEYRAKGQRQCREFYARKLGRTV